jgi:hypothetical protein
MVPWSASSPTRNRQIILSQSAEPASQQPIRSESRARLVEGIARGRYWLGQLTSGEVGDSKEIAKRERCSDRSVRMTVSLAFASPVIAKAAIDLRCLIWHWCARALTATGLSLLAASPKRAFISRKRSVLYAESSSNSPTTMNCIQTKNAVMRNASGIYS